MNAAESYLVLKARLICEIWHRMFAEEEAGCSAHRRMAEELATPLGILVVSRNIQQMDAMNDTQLLLFVTERVAELARSQREDFAVEDEGYPDDDDDDDTEMVAPAPRPSRPPRSGRSASRRPRVRTAEVAEEEQSVVSPATERRALRTSILREIERVEEEHSDDDLLPEGARREAQRSMALRLAELRELLPAPIPKQRKDGRPVKAAPKKKVVRRRLVLHRQRPPLPEDPN